MANSWGRPGQAANGERPHSSPHGVRLRVPDLLALPEWAVLAPLALGLGVVMYLTLFGLSLIPLLELAPDPPGELELLATPGVLIPAAILYLVGWMVRGNRVAELIWECGNVGVRILAAGLLALLVVPDAPPLGQAAAAVLTGGTAGHLHFLRVGWITLDHQAVTVAARRWLQKLGADTVALGLLWLTLLAPEPASLVAAVTILALVIGGGAAYRAARFSMVLLAGLFRWAAGRSGWRTLRRVPRWATGSLPVPFVEEEGGLAVPAGLLHGGGGRSFQDGWLVWEGAKGWFLSRRWRRTGSIPLSEGRVVALRRQTLLTEVELSAPGGDILLLIPAGGPAPEELLGAMGRAKNL